MCADMRGWMSQDTVSWSLSIAPSLAAVVLTTPTSLTRNVVAHQLVHRLFCHQPGKQQRRCQLGKLVYLLADWVELLTG